ncbi:MAG: hypothetical protein ACYTBW_06125 [Planctomycetota bacterium]|jgi:hypothetical protein
MTPADEITIESEMKSTGLNASEKLIYALLLSGGLTMGAAHGMSDTEVPHYYNQDDLKGTLTSPVPGVIIQTEAEKLNARERLIKRLRELRERSIREGATLLSSEQISHELKSMRGE